MYGSVWVLKCCNNCSNITFSVRERHLTFRMYFQITLYVYMYVCVCLCVFKFGTSYRYFSLVQLAYLFDINNL
jgi:hypothetical protein